MWPSNTIYKGSVNGVGRIQFFSIGLEFLIFSQQTGIGCHIGNNKLDSWKAVSKIWGCDLLWYGSFLGRKDFAQFWSGSKAVIFCDLVAGGDTLWPI